MNQEYWEQFVKTGKVEDYLFYRSDNSCQMNVEKYGDKKSESVDDYDGNDSFGNADRRV